MDEGTALSLVVRLSDPAVRAAVLRLAEKVIGRPLKTVTEDMEADQPPIAVWRFEQAPKDLQRLSQNGGDEDWLAEVPPHLVGDDIGWMDQGTRFGCCDVDEFPHPWRPGWVVRIGSHA